MLVVEVTGFGALEPQVLESKTVPVVPSPSYISTQSLEHREEYSKSKAEKNMVTVSPGGAVITYSMSRLLS